MTEPQDKNDQPVAQQFPQVQIITGPTAPRCPFGHKTALIFLKSEYDEEKGKRIFSRQCELASAVSDEYESRIDVMLSAGCPAAETARQIETEAKIPFLKPRKRIVASCKYFNGQWIQDE